MRYEKGESGNPHGRKVGSLNRKTMVKQALAAASPALQGQAAQINSLVRLIANADETTAEQAANMLITELRTAKC
ncbi:MAG: DUF5681 domain-containing protein [Shewanella sp.]